MTKKNKGAMAKPLAPPGMAERDAVAEWLDREQPRDRPWEAAEAEYLVERAKQRPAEWPEAGDRVLLRVTKGSPAGWLAGKFVSYQANKGAGTQYYMRVQIDGQKGAWNYYIDRPGESWMVVLKRLLPFAAEVRQMV